MRNEHEIIQMIWQMWVIYGTKIWIQDANEIMTKQNDNQYIFHIPFSHFANFNRTFSAFKWFSFNTTITSGTCIKSMRALNLCWWYFKCLELRRFSINLCNTQICWYFHKNCLLVNWNLYLAYWSDTHLCETILSHQKQKSKMFNHLNSTVKIQNIASSYFKSIVFFVFHFVLLFFFAISFFFVYLPSVG